MDIEQKANSNDSKIYFSYLRFRQFSRLIHDSVGADDNPPIESGRLELSRSFVGVTDHVKGDGTSTLVRLTTRRIVQSMLCSE